MAQRANYHTHTHYCDGEGTPEEFVCAALATNLLHLGFSSHAPVPFATDWTMPRERLTEYLHDVRQRKQQYRNTIEILMGLEVDYLPGQLSPDAPEIRALDLDYTLGAVHFLGTLQDGTPWTIDGPLEEFETGIADNFGGDVIKAVSRYYEYVRHMVTNHPPTIVAHFDLIKRNNQGDRFFCEGDAWYRQAVLASLDAIAASDCVLEVNTGGLARGFAQEPYPSEWILKECLTRSVPIVLNSDAHTPDQLAGGYAETLSLLKNVGYHKQRMLTSTGWVSVKLT